MSQYHEGNVPIPGYELVEFLGRGSYGEVWKATGPGGTEVAVKFIALDSQQGLKEFKAIGLVKRLRHPNLVPIHAFWLRDSLGNVLSDAPSGDPLESESTRFRIGGRKELVIAMGLGDKSLAQKADDARETGGIAQRQLLRYMDGAARGIDFLNEPVHPPGNSPIIHCDIKPANLLIVGGEVQVCDYGVAQALGTDMKKTLTAGTPAYAPAELINNDPCRQTDQYSLAITYYELRTGQLPFDEKQALRANITGDLDLSLLERDERAVIRRATSLLPERRYPSAQDFVDELRVACGVSMSRSAVIPRAMERRLPPALPPAPSLPTVRSTPKHPPLAAPKDTVTFPESLRPAVATPKPAPHKDDAPWAEGTAMVTALPSTPSTPAPAVRRHWVWPLVVGLVVGIGGVVAYVVTRPAPGPVPGPVAGEPQPKGESLKTPTPTPTPTVGDVLKSLQDATFATPADFPTSAGRFEAALKTADLPAEELSKLRAELPKLVAGKLDAAEGPFKWLDALTVPALPLGKDRDLGAAQKWYAAATDFAAKRGDKDAAARFAALRKFAGFVLSVLDDAKPADRIGYYDRALADARTLPVPKRYSFLLKPLATDPLADLTDDRRADAAKALVRGAEVLVAADDWPAGQPPTPGVRKRDAVQLLMRSFEFDAPSTVATVTDPARRDKLPCDEFAEELGKKAAALASDALKTFKTDPNAARATAETATGLYDDAMKLAPRHPLMAFWHFKLGETIAFHLAADVKTPKEAKYGAAAIRHMQTAYLLAADRVVSGNADPRQDPEILNRSEFAKGVNFYGGFKAGFLGQRDGNAEYWNALAAECAYMQSEMTSKDWAALQTAAKDIPSTAAGDLHACRDRLEKLAKMNVPRKTLLESVGPAKGKN